MRAMFLLLGQVVILLILYQNAEVVADYLAQLQQRLPAASVDSAPHDCSISA